MKLGFISLDMSLGMEKSPFSFKNHPEKKYMLAETYLSPFSLCHSVTRCAVSENFGRTNQLYFFVRRLKKTVFWHCFYSLFEKNYNLMCM
jgi:hypothetical protein